MADPAQEAAKEAGRKVGAFGKFVQALPGHAWRAALDPSAYFVPPTVANVMSGSPTASFVGKSVGEALGIDYDAGKKLSQFGKNQGFLSARNWKDFATAARAKESKGALGKFGVAAFGSAMSIVSVAMTADLVASGYRDNGIAGAATGFGESVLYGIAGRKLMLPVITGIGGSGWGAAKWGFGKIAGDAGLWSLRGAGAMAGGGMMGAAGLLFNPYTALLAAGVYGYGELEEWSRKNDAGIARNKQVRGLELGAPIQDPFGTISTLRQRSLQAIQNTHTNGRMAFGNEAALLHSNY